MEKQAQGAMKHFLQKIKSTVANLKLRFLTEFHLQKEVLNSEVSEYIQDVLGFNWTYFTIATSMVSIST